MVVVSILDIGCQTKIGIILRNTNYFLERNNSGFVEGFNNRLKVLTRRCYGLKNISRFFQRIKIDTEGLYMFRFAGA